MSAGFQYTYQRWNLVDGYSFYESIYSLISIISTHCSIKDTGLIEYTGFLSRVLILSFPKVRKAKGTVSIKSTGF